MMNSYIAILAVLLAPQTVTKPVLTANPPAAQTPSAQEKTPATQTTVQTNAATTINEPQTKIGDTAAQTPPPQPPDASALSTTYIIGPEDTLQVSVWKEPALSGSLPVRPDGMISLSLLGDVLAAGLTPAKLSANITERLHKYIKDPNVTVTVTGFRAKQVYLLGEVGHVGALVITPEMTVLQAISAAGGLSSFADAKHIYILRGEPGKQKKIPFNYKKALKDGNQQGVSLVAGDTIVVP